MKNLVGCMLLIGVYGHVLLAALSKEEEDTGIERIADVDTTRGHDTVSSEDEDVG